MRYFFVVSYIEFQNRCINRYKKNMSNEQKCKTMRMTINETRNIKKIIQEWNEDWILISRENKYARNERERDVSVIPRYPIRLHVFHFRFRIFGIFEERARIVVFRFHHTPHRTERGAVAKEEKLVLLVIDTI